MTEANKFLDKQSEGYDEVKLHELMHLPKIRVQSLMSNFASEQSELKLIHFMLWYKNTVPIGTQKSSRQIVN